MRFEQVRALRVTQSAGWRPARPQRLIEGALRDQRAANGQAQPRSAASYGGIAAVQHATRGKSPQRRAVRNGVATQRRMGTPFHLQVSIIEKRVHTGCMGHPVAVSKDNWTKKRDDLSSKRNALFRKYTKNPDDLTLALEIKTIDDQIADYTAKIREETLAERKSKPAPVVISKN